MQNWLIALGFLLLVFIVPVDKVTASVTDLGSVFYAHPFKRVSNFKIEGEHLGFYRVKPVLLPNGTILLNGNNDSNWSASPPPDQIFNPNSNQVFTSDFKVTGDYIGNYRFLETDWRCMKTIGNDSEKKCLANLGHIYDLKNKTITTLTVEKNAKEVATSLEHFHGRRDGCGASGDRVILKNYHRLEFNCAEENGKEKTYVREFEPETDKFIEYDVPHLTRVRGTYLALNNGQVLLMAGVYPSQPMETQTRHEVELFDPKTRTIKTLFKLENPPQLVWELQDGRILTDGLSGLEVLNLKTGNLKSIERSEKNLREAVQLTNGNILFAGNGRDVLLFDASVSKLKKIGVLPQRRIAHLISSQNGKCIFLVGGYWTNGGYFDRTYKYNDILEYPYFCK